MGKKRLSFRGITTGLLLLLSISSLFISEYMLNEFIDQNEGEVRKVLVQVNSVPRVAFCLRGEYRDLGNLDTLQNFIIDPLRADVFLAMQGADPTKVVHLRPVAMDLENYSYDKIMSLLEEEGFNATLWKTKIDLTFNSLAPFIVQFDKRGGSAIYQYFNMKLCDDLISSYEKAKGFSFDWVVMVRSDDFCLGQPFCLADEDVYVPDDKQDYFGVSDRMIAIRRRYSSRIMRGPWDDLTKNKNFGHYNHNTEKVLKLRIKDALGVPYSYNYTDPRSENFTEDISGLGRPKNTCFIACNPGTHSSWGSCRKNIYEGDESSYKGFKYLDEYKIAHKNVNSTDFINKCSAFPTKGFTDVN